MLDIYNKVEGELVIKVTNESSQFLHASSGIVKDLTKDQPPNSTWCRDQTGI
jgi:hypothetical protein